MNSENLKSVAIIVSHPDEETLWAGGTILSHPFWKCFVVCLSKANDPELAPRFYNALKMLKSEGVMGNLDEIGEKKSINEKQLERSIIQLLPDTHFDIIITHNSFGEKPDNQQHEAVNKSVIKLWQDGFITADELWTFAYENGNVKYYPNSIDQPEVQEQLSKQVWSRKYKIITRIFGHNEKSLKAAIATSTEAFWKFKVSNKQNKSILPFGYNLNIFRTPNIEALKFLYHKSIAFVYDNNYWKYDESNTESFEPETNNKARNSFKNWGKELSIFNTPSIDYLKTLYYKSIDFLFDWNNWKAESSYSDDSFRNSDNTESHKNLFKRKFGNELKIFNTPTIESLKSMYNKSMAFVFEKNRMEPEIALCGDENTQFADSNDSDIKSCTFNKELNIFKTPTIENLKKLYNKKLGRTNK